MSILRANIISESLARAVNISVILPIENGVPAGGFKTLYLLNGFTGDDLDWICETKIKRLALDNNIAVVMPAGENGFYIDDQPGKRNYGKYIGEELVAITRQMFPLSTNREDTMIAGLSMGGYGALRNGLKYNDTFGVIGAFSLALVNELQDNDGSEASGRAYVEQVFGVPVDKIINTDMDPRYILDNFEGTMPRIYMACGTEDFVFECNQLVDGVLTAHNVEHTYVTTPGEHNWEFWGDQIIEFFQWIK